MKFKKKVVRFTGLVFLLFLVFSAVLNAQDDKRAANNIYVELLGNGYFYSLNYERMVLNSLACRVGVMYNLSNDNTNGGTVIPIMVNFLPFNGKHHLEIGGGVTRFSGRLNWDEGAAYLPTAAIGYRYQPPEGGFLFKLTFTPILGAVRPILGGIGFGYSF